MRIIRQNLIRHRINVLARFILRDVQLDQIGALQRRSIHRVRPALFNPGKNMREFENGARRRAHWMRKRLQREGAKVEGKAFERALVVAPPSLCDASADTG